MIKRYQVPNLIRKRIAINHHYQFIQRSEHRYIDFSSNDYLGLKQHPSIKKAYIDGIQQHGTGTGSSALISGYTGAHEHVERAFAEWLGVEKCLLFNSGYTANIGVISALCNRSSYIYADRLCHASIIDGIVLSRATHKRYRHRDASHLKQLITKNKPDLIASDTIFSMNGDLAPLPDLFKASLDSNAILLIDEAHAAGILGQHGKGALEQSGISQHPNICTILPLGKSFALSGAIVAGSHRVIDSILQFARSYHYTTAMPPALCHGIMASLNIIQEEPWRREKLKQNIDCFIHHAIHKNIIKSKASTTPIQPIFIKNINLLISIQQYLLSKGFYVPAIRPPTIPPKQAILRISINTLHTEDDIKKLTCAIQEGLKLC